MGRRNRSLSFHDVDSQQASGLLGDFFQDEDVFFGGASVGKGLKKAANFYLTECVSRAGKPSHLELPGAADLAEECDPVPAEEAFYVLDLGVVVSQVYQWRRFFPRIEPFYAVKCNPDPVVVKTLAILGCNFDCASRNEIRLVQEVTKDLPRKPEIIYANPCKARAHLIEAVCKGVRMVTFDNVTEVEKCAAVSKKIELIMRIVTDDRGSQCRLSSKYGAHRQMWRPLLAAAKKYGLCVVGVSFHVGSGCRDASRYELALKDAREIFDLAKSEYNMDMRILDIGGGFPGETHSMWNPAVEIDYIVGDLPVETHSMGNPAVEIFSEEAVDEVAKIEGTKPEEKQANDDHFMFFTEIAEQIAPLVDKLFPVSSGVRVIGEPGRYFVAAAATLCCSVLAIRTNQVDNTFEPEPIDDVDAATALDGMTRKEEKELVQHRREASTSMNMADDSVFHCIQESMEAYSKLYTSQQLTQQEVDVYTDKLDMFKEGFASAVDMLGPPDEEHITLQHHTVEGMSYPLVGNVADLDDEAPQESTALLTLAAAGQAAVNGIMMQAVADSAPLQDDFAYYINDGVYGAFNNIMFDHASVRPRVLRITEDSANIKTEGGIKRVFDSNGRESTGETAPRTELFSSTVFGPTCDSIDVVARSVLLPKLEVGDFLYMSNMGAYTMAAASSFNGFTPTEKLYVCSVQPEYFEAMIKGPDDAQEGYGTAEEKKELD